MVGGSTQGGSGSGGHGQGSGSIKWCESKTRGEAVVVVTSTAPRVTACHDCERAAKHRDGTTSSVLRPVFSCGLSFVALGGHLTLHLLTARKPWEWCAVPLAGASAQPPARCELHPCE